MTITNFYGVFKKGKQNASKATHIPANIANEEIHPELYVERANDDRKRSIEDIACGVLTILVGISVFAIVQIAFGVWH